MKIGIFSLAYIPFIGGAEVAVKQITDRLPDYRFFCFTFRFKSEWQRREKLGNIDVLRLGNGKGYYGQFWRKFFYIFRAWRAAEIEHKKEPIKIIWAIMASYGGLAALLFKFRHPSIPMLLTLQEGDSESHILSRVGIFYPLWRLIFKKANYIQTISNYLADFARKYGAKCPIEVVPNGVDITKFQIPNSKLQNQNTKTIITTSRLVYKNGIDTLIKAIAILKPKTQNLKAIILGDGSDNQKLKILAKDLGVEKEVQFLGHVEPEKIPDYLRQADIFVRASRSEGLGNSFLEAMAAGLPIIGTQVGGIPDFLKSADANNANGLFVQPDNSQDLAEKILLLLKNDELRKKLGENGRSLVLENYSWDNIAKKMQNIFNTLINI